MRLFEFFTRSRSAPVARERLQVLLAHERAALGSDQDLVAVLREEILMYGATLIARGREEAPTSRRWPG